ncbi:MAG: NAD(P)/FAD-dependent oxidoreductase [Candidatus Margulisiibacteriota bacterium]
MNGFDIIIIGGGVTGTAIARELSRYRIKIALLEKETELAFGVSKSNSGIIHPGTQNPSNSLKGKLCVQGNKLIRKIAKELGVDFKEVGELIVIFDPADMPHLIEIKEEAQKLGVENMVIVGQRWLRNYEPNLSHDAVAALYAPTAGIISPYRLVYDMAENAAANGVKIFTNTRVVGIEYRRCRLQSARTGNDNIFKISTPFAEYKSRYVINCAGLFADEISAMVGVDDFKIKPRKGEEFLLDKKKEHLSNHLLFPLPSKTSKGILVIKTSDGNPMIGPTAVDVEDKNDLSTTPEGLEKVLQGVKRMIPSIDEGDVIAYFAGLRPVAGDDFIIRHENKVPGFINVAGIQSPGLTASPAIALMVVDLLKKAGLSLRKKLFFKRKRQKTMHLFAMPFSKTKKLIKQDPSYGDVVCRCEMVSAKEIKDAITRGARTLDGIKFRTRAQAGRCHGGFCTMRIAKIMAQELGIPITQVTKRGKGSEIILGER